MTTSSIKPKHQDGRRNNGGARTGAGRPRSAARVAREKQFEQLALQKILIPVRSGGQIRYKKVTVMTAILDSLLESALRDNNLRAAQLYLDTTIGKPVRIKPAGGASPRYRESFRKYDLLRNASNLKYGKMVMEVYTKKLMGS